MPKELVITGEVSIKPGRATSRPEVLDLKIMIMGPTGSGKSTFIEALAGKGRSLGISKDQLAGFTQEVTAYELRHAKYQNENNSNFPIFLIDTPGFSDSKISEMDIICKVKEWIKDQDLYWINSIIYLCPISATRVPGSKRRTIKMLLSLLQEHSGCKNLIVVTTMWDGLSNSRTRERAEAHFIQLRDDIWKDLINEGGRIMKFHNTQDSALEVIRVLTGSQKFDGRAPLFRNPVKTADRYAPFLYEDLLDRINSCQQELESLRQDEVQLITKPDRQLESVVIPRLREVRCNLSKFLDQLTAFSTPPPGFEGVPEQVISQHLLNHVEEAQTDKRVLALAIEELEMHPNRRRELLLKYRVAEAQATVDRLSKYVDASGRPLPFSQENSVKQVLEALRPKSKVPFMDRVGEGVSSLKKMLTWH